MHFYRGKGCTECRESGFTGRIVIYEILPVTENIRTLISGKFTTDSLVDMAIKEGMITMLQDGIDKVSAGLTTIEEVLRVVQEA